MTPVTDRKDLKFMLLLASFCALLLIMTRAAIGERAEISLRSVDAILQIAGEKTLPVEEQLLDRFNQLFSRRAGGRIKFWQGGRRPELWACELPATACGPKLRWFYHRYPKRATAGAAGCRTERNCRAWQSDHR